MAEKTAQLKGIVKLAQHQLINLYFADESGFSLTPYVPYGWQPVGKQCGIPTKKEHIANVLGFLNPLNNQLITYTARKKEKIDSHFMVSRINDMAQSIEKETVVVLDNAPWHRSKRFMENIDSWQEQGLFIFHLPTYSPHLNLIETLWRKVKYEWIRPKDYNSKTALNKRLKEIFTTYGEQFKINFSLNIYT
jgi:transposase